MLLLTSCFLSSFPASATANIAPSDVKSDPSGAGTIESEHLKPFINAACDSSGAGTTGIDVETNIDNSPNECNPDGAGTLDSEFYGGCPILHVPPVLHEIDKDVPSFRLFKPLKATCKTSVSAKETYDILQDACSNSSLIDESFLRSHYPDAVISLGSSQISGIGSAKTIGSAHINVWICGAKTDPVESTSVSECLIQLDLHVHILKSFAHKILMGVESLYAYGISLNPKTKTANLSDGLKY
ncbi:hypothetical protein DFH27DRAFT_621448 [Peziza echinospora]|nr:hypothetical protein DFH27DRAFT_621448 [Peziza echinospora]